jgi:hypothetical protein
MKWHNRSSKKTNEFTKWLHMVSYERHHMWKERKDTEEIYSNGFLDQAKKLKPTKIFGNGNPRHVNEVSMYSTTQSLWMPSCCFDCFCHFFSRRIDLIIPPVWPEICLWGCFYGGYQTIPLLIFILWGYFLSHLLLFKPLLSFNQILL